MTERRTVDTTSIDLPTATFQKMWSRTAEMQVRLGNDITRREGRSWAFGRPIIARDTPIDGGIYLGAFPREAVVVDTDKYPAIGALYHDIIKSLDAKPAQEFMEDPEQVVLQAIYKKTQEVYRRSLNTKEADTLNQLVKAIGFQDKKVALDYFIESGIGDCRHFALTCGALIERGIRDGILEGTVSVDRNQVQTIGHAWTRFTNKNGEITVLDIKRDYLGPVAGGNWIYQRPEEILKEA